jgi:hypothetical protein
MGAELLGKGALLDKLTEAGGKGVTLAEARRYVPDNSLDSLVRKGVIVVAEVGDKGAQKVWLRVTPPS